MGCYHPRTVTDPEIDDDDDAFAEDDVLVQFRLGNRALGTAAERAEIESLGEQLGEAVAAAGVGEYDGDESGAGECILFFAGPDAERLFAVLQPLLRGHPRGRGAKVTLQRRGGTPIVRQI